MYGSNSFAFRLRVELLQINYQALVESYTVSLVFCAMENVTEMFLSVMFCLPMLFDAGN